MPATSHTLSYASEGNVNFPFHAMHHFALLKLSTSKVPLTEEEPIEVSL